MKRRFNSTKFYMSILSFAILALAISFSGCDEDGGEILQPTLAGTYVLQKITVSEDYIYQDNTLLEAGTDVTAEAGGGIIAAAPCDNKVNTAIDLRDNNDLYFVCIGESNELKAGTWSENDAQTILNLNLSSPPFPSNLVLVVEDIEKSLTKITGTINSMPVDKALFEEAVPSGISLPPALLLSVEVEFVIVPDIL